jgi:hypothetical protein
LLVFGSLVGFVAFHWLLGHVSATLVGTYAYVNPAVAILVGWLVGGEELTGWILGGMIVILVGVALVRSAGGHAPPSGKGPKQAAPVASPSANGRGATPEEVARETDLPQVS